eukprot:Tbor_TRINITY_DN5333_c0_g2::TRINITY_DN5333_c0_g2_i2::g.4749::m.4749
MRRTPLAFYYWLQYKVGHSSPKIDGPPPKSAPQNFNDTKSVPQLDPIEDKFPRSITGGHVLPDVPKDQFTQMWYVGDRLSLGGKEMTSWVASAPPNAYRFRPFDEFDSKGREFVENMRKFVRQKSKTEDRSFLFREAYLTKMNDVKTPKPSLETIMDHHTNSSTRKQNNVSVLAKQRDIGRYEKPPECAGKIPVDSTQFPFSWNTDDWYEYEIAKVRNRRFKWHNIDTMDSSGSEATYLLIVEALWDHHAERMAQDVCEFVREVGRQAVEEKLISIRETMGQLRNGNTASIDPDIIASFPKVARENKWVSEYTPAEVAQFIIAELEGIENQCLSILARTTSSQVDRKDKNASWPHIRELEPWARLVEYWRQHGDKHWSQMEASTSRVEFRRFFRIVEVKMPFVSHEFEKRLFDIRHWAHRSCGIEYQIIYSANVCHDKSQFPVEHDYIQPHSHENHRMFSFALDWHEAPARQGSLVIVEENDTWETISIRIGSSIEALKEENDDVDSLKAGMQLAIPAGATKTTTSHGHTMGTIPVSEGKNRLYKTWEEIAKVFDCEVSDLQEVNAAICEKDGSLSPSAEAITVPYHILENSPSTEFATVELTFEGDTWEIVAKRLGCSVDTLKEKNALNGPPEGAVHFVAGTALNIPEDAKHLRRIADPLLRVDTLETITSVLQGEKKRAGLEDGIPMKPEGAEKYPYEYMDSTTRYPFVPSHDQSTEDWLRYTATYLDKGMRLGGEAVPVYNVNKVWPEQQIPGTRDQTPFEEDQTWMMHHIPVQQQEMFHAEGYLQDLHNINNEMFPKSLDWRAP